MRDTPHRVLNCTFCADDQREEIRTQIKNTVEIENKLSSLKKRQLETAESARRGRARTNVTSEDEKNAADRLELVQSNHRLQQRRKYEAIEQKRQAAIGHKRQKKEHA